MTIFFSIDKAIFLFFNRSLANPVFDVIMPFITDLDNWRIPILIVFLLLLIFGGKKGRIVALLVVLVLALTDQMSSFVLKSWVKRVRPCFVVEGVRLLINQSRSYSFPSSHASNMAAMATLFSIKYRRYTAIFIAVAAIVAYSRIYVGVHYPSDILGGILVGILCAALILGIERGIQVLCHKREKSDRRAPQEDFTEKS